MKYDYENGVLKLKLNEEIDINSSKVLRDVIDGYIIKYQPENVQVDLSEVTFMDSSGLGLIIGRYNLLKMMDSSLTILNPSTSIKRIIELSNLKEKIKMEEVQ